MKDLKYITWETSDGIPTFVLFPQHLKHADIAEELCKYSNTKVIGAGFAEMTVSRITGEDVVVQPSGHSESLKVGVHPSDYETLNS